jgi:hypothetical protein
MLGPIDLTRIQLPDVFCFKGLETMDVLRGLDGSAAANACCIG